MHLFIFFAFFTIGLATADDSHWGYPNLDNLEEYPHWGGICDTGNRQSPIDLSLKGALKGEYDKFEFDNYDDKQTEVEMVNNGHTIQLSQFPYKMELEGGPLLEEYVVEQIHLHWWSEHTVDNIRYPLEAHVVHRNKRYANMTEAASYKDGIAVIGILYHVSNERNDAIEKIVDNLDAVKSYTQLNKPIRMKEAFTVRDLFPEIEGYFTYAGSLTTPSCAEAVQWIVLLESFPVTLDQVDKFKEIEYDEGMQLRNNYRSIQSTNNRPIIAVLEEKRGNSATSANISLGAVLLIVFFAKFLQ